MGNFVYIGVTLYWIDAGPFLRSGSVPFLFAGEVGEESMEVVEVFAEGGDGAVFFVEELVEMVDFFLEVGDGGGGL